MEVLAQLPSLRSPQEVWDFLVSLVTHPVSISAGGDLQFSIKSLVIAGVIVFVMLRFSGFAQRLLQRRVLSHLSLDAGLAYTLQRLLHYALIALGVLFALKIGVGADLTSLAVLVTALSVGIGLGLKEISGDVAAGFILLFERPLRVGDRVKLNSSLGIEGDVIGIDLRTTKIRTLDRLTVIVPNSKLTNDVYVNRTYHADPVRVRIQVGVAYGSDVTLVKNTLLEAAREVPQIVADPAPDVMFVGFGASTLDFALIAWTAEQKRTSWVQSDVNFKIDEKFRKARIEMPFPQQDVNIRNIAQAS